MREGVKNMVGNENNLKVLHFHYCFSRTVHIITFKDPKTGMYVHEHHLQFLY